jgi:Tfp pilus assembly protein PilP
MSSRVRLALAVLPVALAALLAPAAMPVSLLAQGAARPQPAPVPSAETYVYEPDGRRDPFVSLLATANDARDAAKHIEGPAGMSVAEVSVRGVLQSRTGLIAMVQGPDSKTYLVHQGDKFLDGTIRSITPQGLVVVQDVHDPLSLVKQREIRKLLRSLEETKE